MPTRWTVTAAVMLLSLVGLAGIPAAQARHRRHPVHHGHGRGGALAYMGREPEPSIFGIDTGTYDSNHANWVRDVPAAHGLGARWDRVDLSATGGFGMDDFIVKQDRHRGMGVILSLGGIRGACSLRPLPSNVRACPPSTAGDLRAYKGYVRRVLLHYRNVVSYYESWTEANNGARWLPAADPAAYASLLKADHSVFRAVNRRYNLHLKLLFGSLINFAYLPTTRGATAVLPFTRRVLDDLHGQRPFDGITLHAYRFPAGTESPSATECDYVDGDRVRLGYATRDCPAPRWRLLTWPQELSAYEQMFSGHGYGQEPLWLTEFGWPGNANPGGDYFPSYSTQADDLREAYNDLLGLPFVQGALWFNVRDYQPGHSSPDPSFFYHYGLFNYDYSQKPAASAFKALADANPHR